MDDGGEMIQSQDSAAWDSCLAEGRVDRDERGKGKEKETIPPERLFVDAATALRCSSSINKLKRWDCVSQSKVLNKLSL